MAIKYKGEVEFQDSTGRTFVLRLGQFQFLSNKQRLAGLEPQEYQTHILQIALVAGAESQQDFTFEDAAEIIDDLGYKRINDLIKQTKFYRNVDEVTEADKVEKAAAAARAAAALTPTIQALRKDASAESLAILDALEQEITAGQPKAAGSANPPAAGMSTSG